MAPPASYEFTPRWKELLVIKCPQGSLVVEMTMGVLEVSFPTPERWSELSPPWAQARYGELLEALRRWCAQQKIPLVVDQAAWVEEETAKG
jgi:hypothetical protein